VMAGLRRGLPRDYAWPGNVRELEQGARRIILNGEYLAMPTTSEVEPGWLQRMKEGQLTAQEVLGGYCRMLYEQYGTYEEVAQRTALDRRTAKKYVGSGSALFGKL